MFKFFSKQMNKIPNLELGLYTSNLSTQWPRHKNPELEASLGYRARKILSQKVKTPI